MTTASIQTWGDLFQQEERSWEDCISPEERVGGPSEWGNSRYSVFERCPHLYEIHFVRRLRPKARKKALEVGGLFHEARALFYAKGVDAAWTLINRCESHVPGIVVEVRRLFDGWLAAHGPGRPTDDSQETVALEQLLETDEGFPYTCRLDRLIYSEELGGPVVMEIKTASRRTEMLLKNYAVDGQFLGQQFCYRHSKFYRKYGPLKAFIVDLAVKGSPMQFPREIIPINQYALREWIKEKRHLWARIQLCEAEGYWPRHRANCVMYGELCEAHDHCAIAGKGKNPFPGWEPKEEGTF